MQRMSERPITASQMIARIEVLENRIEDLQKQLIKLNDDRVRDIKALEQRIVAGV